MEYTSKSETYPAFRISMEKREARRMKWFPRHARRATVFKQESLDYLSQINTYLAYPKPNKRRNE